VSAASTIHLAWLGSIKVLFNSSVLSRIYRTGSLIVGSQKLLSETHYFKLWMYCSCQSQFASASSSRPSNARKDYQCRRCKSCNGTLIWNGSQIVVRSTYLKWISVPRKHSFHGHVFSGPIALIVEIEVLPDPRM